MVWSVRIYHHPASVWWIFKGVNLTLDYDSITIVFWVLKNHFPRGKLKQSGRWGLTPFLTVSLIINFPFFNIALCIGKYFCCGMRRGGSQKFSRWMGQKINWIQTSTTSSLSSPDFDKIPSYIDSMGNGGNWEAAIVLQSMTASTWKLTILSMCVLLVLTGAREGVVMQQQSALSPPLPIHDSSVCREIGWQGTLFVDHGGWWGVLIKRGGARYHQRGQKRGKWWRVDRPGERYRQFWRQNISVCWMPAGKAIVLWEQSLSLIWNQWISQSSSLIQIHKKTRFDICHWKHCQRHNGPRVLTL